MDDVMQCVMDDVKGAKEEEIAQGSTASQEKLERGQGLHLCAILQRLW